MKNILILLFTSLFFSNTLSAQFGMGKPKDIKALSERKMIVITETLSKKAADKLRRKGKDAELADIQKRYDAFNAMVKNVISNRWTMHKDVEYKTWAEFKKISDKRRKNYGVIYFMTKRASNTRAGYLSAGYTMLNSDMDETDVKEHSFISLFQTFTIDKAEDIPVDKIKFNATPVYSITLPELYPSALSVTYAITCTNIYFTKRLEGGKVTRKSFEKEVAQNSARLADKTLLVLEDWVDRELTLQDIKDIYPHPVRIVNEQELVALVNSKDPKYAWFVVVPVVNSGSRTNSIIFMHQIVDNGDGDICGMYLPSLGKMILKAYTGGSTGKDRMTDKTLEAMVKDMK